MGARPGDYEAVAPHNSFIHVDQFTGPRELAEYLLELDKDDEKYNQYFQVSKSGHNQAVVPTYLCYFSGKEQESSSTPDSSAACVPCYTILR